MTTRVIALTGKKWSGKDTAIECVEDHTRLAYADPLKYAAMHLFDLTYEQVFDETWKDVVDPRYGKTPRQLLQLLGTDWVRNLFDKDHFVKLLRAKLMKEILDRRGRGGTIFISDSRFDNEVKPARDVCGKVVHIRRPQTEQSCDTHESEAGISKELIDFHLLNDSDDKETLWQKMREIVEQVPPVDYDALTARSMDSTNSGANATT